MRQIRSELTWLLIEIQNTLLHWHKVPQNGLHSTITNLILNCILHLQGEIYIIDLSILTRIFSIVGEPSISESLADQWNHSNLSHKFPMRNNFSIFRYIQCLLQIFDLVSTNLDWRLFCNKGLLPHRKHNLNYVGLFGSWNLTARESQSCFNWGTNHWSFQTWTWNFSFVSWIFFFLL
jgi:hypothetical protein